MSWIKITDKKPNNGDIIACKAEHCNGGLMYWAGTVLQVRPDGLVVMETKNERTRNFIITIDTEWIKLPQ